MSDWNGYPWDRPGLDDSQRRMWAMADEFSTAASYREQAVRERDANLGDEQRALIVELDQWWQREMETRA